MYVVAISPVFTGSGVLIDSNSLWIARS